MTVLEYEQNLFLVLLFLLRKKVQLLNVRELALRITALVAASQDDSHVSSVFVYWLLSREDVNVNP